MWRECAGKRVSCLGLAEMILPDLDRNKIKCLIDPLTKLLRWYYGYSVRLEKVPSPEYEGLSAWATLFSLGDAV